MRSESPSPSVAAPVAHPLPPAIPRPARRKMLIQGAAGALVGGVIGYSAAYLGDVYAIGGFTFDQLRERYGDASLAFMMGGVVLASWVVIALHEVGHAIGGYLVGFRFVFLMVGPLRVDRDDTTERIRFGLNRELSLYGGIAGACPTDTRNLSQRLAWFVAAGPLASVLTALLGGGALLAAGGAMHPLLRFLMGALTVLSAAIALVTLIPMRSGGMSSDGARLLRLVRRGPEATREAALLSLYGLFTSGVRPREWPAELVATARSHRDGSADQCLATAFGYYNAVDRGDLDEAGRLIDEVLSTSDGVPPAMLPALLVDAAFFEALYRGRVDVAREYMEKVPAKSLGVKAYERTLVGAAIALRQGDAAAARERLGEARAQLPAGGAAFARVQIEELERAIAGAA